MNDVQSPPPRLPDDDEFPPPIRAAWWVLAGVLVLLPLMGLILLFVPQPWKALLVGCIVVLCVVLLGRLLWLSRMRTYGK
jgi:protein-S-isoprenylcysteine O-methyltransferase Ste14